MKYKFAGSLPLIVAGLIIGANLGMSAAVRSLPLKHNDMQSTLNVTTQPDGRLYTAYQLQDAAALQVTVDPQNAYTTIQGNTGDQTDGDTLQPALGYGALGWTLQ